jgi:hypothetical protein
VSEINLDKKTQSEKLSEETQSEEIQEEKILFFEQQFGPYENQKSSYKFTFKGNKVDILYKYSDYTSPVEKAELKDGKIIKGGCSDCYVLNQNSLCVPNPETGQSDCYSFIRSKSTHDIEETMNPTTSNNNSTQENSNKFSLGDIRGQIIEGSKQEMIRIYGEPDEEYYAHDFLKKYFDFEPFSVYSAEFNIGQTVFIYRNIETNNKPILVLYYESKIISVKYLSDIKSYKDLSR